MRTPPLATLALSTVLALGSTAAADTVVLQPSSQDAFIQKDKPNRIAGSGPTHTRIRVQASPPDTKTRRGLVQFDLSVIPGGSTINSAVLGLFEGNNPSVPVVHGAHRITDAWLQSTVSWNKQPPHQGLPSATAALAADTTREFQSFDVTGDVQDFVDFCQNNHGWLIKDQDETATGEDVNYVSREEDAIPDLPNRPKLTLDFDPPECREDADCLDASFCTTGERCENGSCVVDPVVCDDQDPCTDDICDCTRGCVSFPICDDGFACTLDTCDPQTLACTSTPDNDVCLGACALGFCDADPDSTTVDPDTGCENTTLLPAGTGCDDGDPCTQDDACDGLGACVGTGGVCDHYVVYKAKHSKLETLADENKFPKGWAISLDDAQLTNTPEARFTDDPENYLVLKERGLANPAMKNDEPGPFSPDRHYIRYQIKGSREGIGAQLPDGKFPKTVKAPKRLWEVTNQFGTLFVETKKAIALWVPTTKVEAPDIPAAPEEATHFICYKAKASDVPSDQAPDLKGNGKGKFRTDLQHYFSDQFDDCPLFKDGVTVPFAGTAVEGKCLFDLRQPRELCSPVDKSPIEPPRDTTAAIPGSIAAVRDQSLLCYKAKLTAKVAGEAAAALGGLQVGDKIKQQRHSKRLQRNGTQLNTFPGNQFPRPIAMDTKQADLVCVPTTVLSVTDL